MTALPSTVFALGPTLPRLAMKRREKLSELIQAFLAQAEAIRGSATIERFRHLYGRIRIG
jgi:hypothetical protein